MRTLEELKDMTDNLDKYNEAEISQAFFETLIITLENLEKCLEEFNQRLTKLENKDKNVF